jgi:hypothetical protein
VSGPGFSVRPMAQLMRCEPTPHARLAAERSWVRTPADAHWRPRVGPRSTQNSAPTDSVARNSSHGVSCSHAHRSMLTSRRLPPFRAEPRSRHE